MFAGIEVIVIEDLEQLNAVLSELFRPMPTFEERVFQTMPEEYLPRAQAIAEELGISIQAASVLLLEQMTDEDDNDYDGDDLDDDEPA